MAEVLIAVGSMPNVLAWRNNTGALRGVNGRFVRFGLVGSPDILACVNGRFVGLECKTARGKQSQAQMVFAAALSAAGGVYAVVRSAEEAKNIFEGLKKNC